MNITLKSLWDLMIQTITSPREGARAVLALPVPEQAWKVALVLVVVLSMLVSQISAALSGGLVDPMSHLLGTPVLISTAVVVAMTWGMAWMVYRIGALFDGKGDFNGALRLVVWLQAIMLALQIATQMSLFVFPLLAALLWFASMFLMLWLATVFVAEVHGFKSLFPVFAGLITTVVLTAVALSFILSLLGFAPNPELLDV